MTSDVAGGLAVTSAKEALMMNPREDAGRPPL